MNRIDGRAPDQLRPIHFEPHIAPHATGSVLASFGNTKVICAATVEEGVPRWMKEQNVPGGWITSEYSMLPYSTLGRKPRDISKGKQDGRSVEIQRLIGRSLRASIDLEKLGARTLWVDCDVLQADGGTRTAAITGASVAVSMACHKLMSTGILVENPVKHLVAAVSTGIVGGEAVLDLSYVEDRDAAVDFNVVLVDTMDFVEVQGSGEEATFSQAGLDRMLVLAKGGCAELFRMQRAAIDAAVETVRESSTEVGVPLQSS
jgi:ribonuclease PH